MVQFKAVPADEYEEFARFRGQRHSFATANLPEDKVRPLTLPLPR